MRILLTITCLGVGGAERIVTSLADEYVSKGNEVMLVRFHGEAELQPKDPRVKLENLNMSRSMFGVLAGLVRLRRLIRAFRPDVVNSHLVHANLLTRVLRLVTPMPRLISSAHNTNEQGHGRMLVYRLTDRLADISTNVSEAAVEAFEVQGALKPGRMLAIHNGIDTTSFKFSSCERERLREELELPENALLLLAVGRLCEPKDYPNLLRAFAQLQLGVDARLVIVGDGPLRDEIQELAESLHVKQYVRFLGIRHDVPALMSACDLFVLSSAWEGFGLVVAEAMACRRPVVATDCGGVREVVGGAGFLVPPQDVDALAEAMARALDMSSEECERLCSAGRKRVEERYSLQATAQRYLCVYRGQTLISNE